MDNQHFISMNELYTHFQNLKDNELIVDVRTDEEFSEGHVPGSDHIPFEQIAKKATEYRKYAKVYLYCRSGMRSQKAYHILKDQGLTNLVCVSEGGMMTWSAAGLPEEK